MRANGASTPQLLTVSQRDGYAKAVQKLFKKSSSKKVGFMLWLDFSKVSIEYLLSARPSLLPALDRHVDDDTVSAAQRIAK
jgi:hypothetical protein